SRLSSNSAWDAHGRALASTLLSAGTRSAAERFVEICHEARNAAGPDWNVRPIHTVLAQALAQLARSALERADRSTARRALSALAHLSPRSCVRGSVRALAELDPGD